MLFSLPSSPERIFFAGLTFCLFSLSVSSVNAQIAPEPAKGEPGQELDASPSRPATGATIELRPDIDVDGGVGYAFAPGEVAGFGRARFGVLTWIEPRNPREGPLLISLGATYGLSNYSFAEVGVEVEITSLTHGWWVQSGAAVDVLDPGPVWRLGVGWSVVGVEVQRRTIPREDLLPNEAAETFIIGGKLRAPIGPLLKLLGT